MKRTLLYLQKRRWRKKEEGKLFWMHRQKKTTTSLLTKNEKVTVLTSL